MKKKDMDIKVCFVVVDYTNIVVLLTKHKESIQIYFDALKKYCNSSTK
jgi:hypothetical protein